MEIVFLKIRLDDDDDDDYDGNFDIKIPSPFTLNNIFYTCWLYLFSFFYPLMVHARCPGHTLQLPLLSMTVS